MTDPVNGACEANVDQPAIGLSPRIPGLVLGPRDCSATEADEVLSSESSESGLRKADNYGSKATCTASDVMELGRGFGGGGWAGGEPPPVATCRREKHPPSTSLKPWLA